MSLMEFIGNKKPLEEFIKSNKFTVQYKKIKFDSIVFSAFAQLKCMNCGMFKRNYHCLATPRWKKSKEILSKYEVYYLVYIQIDNTERINYLLNRREQSKKQGKRGLNDWAVYKYACNTNQVIIVNMMRKFLISIKVNYFKENLRLFGAGGGCRSCRVCGLIKPKTINKPITPCKKPNESFGAPESIGIDVYATLKKNKIEHEIIPKNMLITVGLICQK